MELKTGGMAASPHVLPDETHLDTYEQVVRCFRILGAPEHLSTPFPSGIIFFFCFFHDSGCAFFIFLPREEPARHDASLE